MKSIAKTLLLLSFLISIFSCANNSKNEDPLEIISQKNDRKEKDNSLGVLNKQDTLKITVEFSECGEWGGHREMILLQRNEDNNVIARLQIDSISCEKIITKYDLDYKQDYSDLDDNERIVILDKEKILTKNEEREISNFIINLLEIYLKNDYFNRDEDSLFMYQGSGSTLQIINTNSTLNFTFYNTDNYANTKYSKVRDMIFREIN